MIDKIKFTLYIIGKDGHTPAWSAPEGAGRVDHSLNARPAWRIL